MEQNKVVVFLRERKQGAGHFPEVPAWECKATQSAELFVPNEALHCLKLRPNRKGPMSWKIVRPNENLRPE
jgi:hypothetical protein